MDDSTASEQPVRSKLLRGHRWPKDFYGVEIDVDDFVLFTDYRSYPTPSIGQVFRIGKTGKVHVRTIKLFEKDRIDEIEVKECSSVKKLSPTVVNALLMDKLARQ